VCMCTHCKGSCLSQSRDHTIFSIHIMPQLFLPLVENKLPGTVTHVERKDWCKPIFSFNMSYRVCSVSPHKNYKLQHTATHCNTLQHTAGAHLWHKDCACNTLPHIVIHCSMLHHTASHCITLHFTASHCIALHHTATHCNTLQHTAGAHIWQKVVPARWVPKYTWFLTGGPEVCQGRPTYMKRDSNIWKHNYERDLYTYAKRPPYLLLGLRICPISCWQSCGMSKETYIHQKRPIHMEKDL